MNSAKILYQLLNVFIILILFSVGLGMVLFALIFLGFLPLETFSIQSEIIGYKNDPGLNIFVVSMLIVYSVFVYGIWKMKEATKLLLAHKFYTPELIKKIIIAGKCMILAGVFAWLIDGLSSIYFKQEISIGMSDKTFIYLFIIAMGLFMMLMGNVLKDAKNLKEEVDLTI